MAKKKKTVAQRVTDLEEREGILYGYIDDLRASTKRAEKRFEEFLATNEKRMEQNEENLREMRREHGEQMRELKDTQSILSRLLLHMNARLDDHDRRLPAAA